MNRTDTTSPGAATSPAERRAKRVWPRRLLLTSLLLILLVVGVMFTVTRSWFIVAVLRSELERSLGGQLLIDHASYVGDGRFVFENFRLLSREHEGPAAQIVGVRRAVVRVEMATILSGEPRVLEVVLNDAVVRISEDIHEAGSFSFMGLDPQRDPARVMPTSLPPRVEVNRAVIEYGRHEGATYLVQGSRIFAGAMQAEDPLPGPVPPGGRPLVAWYGVHLREIDDVGRTLVTGLTVNGRWNALTFEHEGRVEGLTLDPRTENMCPEAVRVWWEKMDLQGRVAYATMEWREDGNFELVLEVDDITLTLPINTEDLFVRYEGGRIVERPVLEDGAPVTVWKQRMNVRGGTIRLSNREIQLTDLRGDLYSTAKLAEGNGGPTESSAAMPYSIRLVISELPALSWADRETWMDHVLEAAPFKLTIQVQDFSVTDDAEGRSSAIDLPVQVAQMLEAAEVSDWTLSMKMQASRTAGKDEIETTGEAFISSRAAAYPRFPYRLSNVQASVRFTNDRATIDYLTGVGPSGAAVRVTGDIAPLGRYPGANLTLIAEQVPLDEHLRHALNQPQRELFDSLLHAPSAASLREAGLLADADALDRMRSELRDISARVDAFDHDDRSDRDTQSLLEELVVRQRQKQLKAILTAGPFDAPGGVIDLDLKLRREPGPGHPLLITGETRVRWARLIAERFPYPIIITGGSLMWDVDRVSIMNDETTPGLSFTAPGGGRGAITGYVARTYRTPESPEPPQAAFDFSITADDDAINELVYAAIPLNDHETADDHDTTWPGTARSHPARLLRSLGMEGALTYSGRVWRDPGEEIDYRFYVAMLEGRARPTEELKNMISAVGLLWPEGLVIDRVRGDVSIARERIELTNFTGLHTDGRLTAGGSIDRSGEAPVTELNVVFSDLTLGRYLIDLVPQESADLARELWERYNPSGSFNAHLFYRDLGGQAEPVRLAVEPVVTRVTLRDEVVTLERAADADDPNSDGGQITIDSDRVAFDKLFLRMKRGDRDDGQITLTGSYGITKGDERLDARGYWIGGQFDSPLIDEALRLIGAEEHAQRYRSFRPFGEFDASFHYASTPGAQQDYAFTLSPRSLGFEIDGVQAAATLSADSRIMLTPRLVEIPTLSGTHDGGSFAVSGLLRFDPLLESPVDASLRVSHTGSTRSPLVRAVLPPAVRDTMDALGFNDGNGTTIDNATLQLAQVRAGGPWRAQFRGEMHTDGASITAGIPISAVSGTFAVFARHEPDSPLVLEINGDIAHMRVVDQTMTDVLAADIHYDAVKNAIVVPELRGDCHEGAVWATAIIGVGENREYDATFELVSVSLAGLLADDGTRRSRLPDGKLYGSLRLAGLRDDAQSRTGRGTVHAMGGSVISLPLALQIVNLLQFIAPLRNEIDYADAAFFIDGQRLVFEKLLFESTMGGGLSLQLIGEGEMNVDTLELKTQFRTRSGMLLLRDLAGGLGDQLYRIEVVGTLRNPRARIVPLPGLGG